MAPFDAAVAKSAGEGSALSTALTTKVDTYLHSMPPTPQPTYTAEPTVEEPERERDDDFLNQEDDETEIIHIFIICVSCVAFLFLAALLYYALTSKPPKTSKEHEMMAIQGHRASTASV